MDDRPLIGDGISTGIVPLPPAGVLVGASDLADRGETT